MKKISKIIFLIFTFFVVFPKAAYADVETLGDLWNEYQKAVREKQANDNKTEAAKKEIAAKEAAIKKAEKELNEAREDYEEAEMKIQESNEKIASLKQEVEKVLLYLQQVKGQNAYVEYVSGASSMTELITRIEAVNQITDYIQRTVNELENEIKENEKLKEELLKKQEEINKKIESYQAAIKKLYANLEDYDAFADSAEKKVETTKETYEIQKKVCQDTIGKTDHSVKIAECTTTSIPNNAGWLKPLNSGVITSTIGSRWGSYHNALDIGGNREGTNIYAAAAGKVAAIQYKTSCGGNRVYIFVTVGGKKYTTFYYHLKEVKVKVGQIVTQNTVIGTVGGYSTSTAHGGYDSCTTGAHLHFGVANGWYGYHVGRGYVITPPGFPNREWYSFKSRYDFYQG